MAWVVDTCVLLDIRIGDSAFAEKAARCLIHHQSEGLLVAPMTYVELAPAFHGDRQLQEEFLFSRDVIFDELWKQTDTEAASILWFDYVLQRRQNRSTRRPLADVLIAAFASRWQGLITRNVSDFRGFVPTLNLMDSAAF